MPAVSHTEVFSCSVEQFYKVISDYERYPEFLNEVKECRVIKSEGARRLVEYKVSVLKTFTYSLWMSEQPPLRISWTLASGDLFKTSIGSWDLMGEGEGKTRAIYNVDATFSMFVPGPIAKTLMTVNLPMMMSSYHKRIKELYL